MLSRLRTFTCLSSPIRSVIRRRNASKSFVVRTLKTPEEVQRIIIERAAANGWRPGALDHVSFFAADKTGFFVGELNGEPISCVSVVKYTENYAFLGNYKVDEQYRGRGYGFLTWKAAMDSINKDYNLTGHGSEEKVHVYKKTQLGFQATSLWYVQRFDLVASQVGITLSDIQSPSAVTIQPACEVDFNDLLEYDTHVHVFPRQAFLEKWISAPNCHASVAISDNGRVVGYTVVRTTLKKGDGWRIGPLFADNAEIARSLYREACGKVAAEDPQGIIAVDVPYGDLVNPDALKMVKELSGIPVPKMKGLRAYTKGIPSNMPLQKLFGITTLELG